MFDCPVDAEPVERPPHERAELEQVHIVRDRSGYERRYVSGDGTGRQREGDGARRSPMTLTLMSPSSIQPPLRALRMPRLRLPIVS